MINIVNQSEIKAAILHELTESAVQVAKIGAFRSKYDPDMKQITLTYMGRTTIQSDRLYNTAAIDKTMEAIADVEANGKRVNTVFIWHPHTEFQTRDMETVSRVNLIAMLKDIGFVNIVDDGKTTGSISVRK